MKQSLLERGDKSKGIRGYARKIGIDESTLRHHLKVRKVSVENAENLLHIMSTLDLTLSSSFSLHS